MAEGEAAPAEVKPNEPASAEPAAPAGNEAPARDPNKVYTQAEVDQIASKLRKNERYRTRKEVEAYYQGRESAAKPAPSTPAAEPAKAPEPPKREEFGTYEEYLRADAAFTADRSATAALDKRDREATERTAREAAQKRAQDFQVKVREKYPDFDQRIADVGDMPMHRGVQDAISESEFGPDILNELVGKPAELERLAKLSESSAVREIGKMEARLEAAAQAAKQPGAAPANPDPKAVKEPSKAPEPVRPLGATKVAADPNDLSRLTDKPEEWAKARNRELLKRRTGT